MKPGTGKRIALLVAWLLVASQLTASKNIVVILADDHALKVTGTYGNQIIRTPSIDRLASEGITFTSTYCNSPICSASRQSLLTGKYPHATGVNLLFTPFPDEGNLTIAEHLRNHGYQTGIFGKNHWNNWVWGPLYQGGPPSHGFNVNIGNVQHRLYLQSVEQQPIERECYDREKAMQHPAERMNWRILPHPVHDEHSEGRFLVNQAVRFFEENKDTPFLAWIAFHQPHAPFYFPVEFADKYDPSDMPLPMGSPEDDRWIPERFKHLTEPQKRGIIAAYYTSTEYMDRNVGLLLDALDELELADDTIVIYLSDNGYLLNDHKRFEKHTMWEEAIRQPMILRDGISYRPGEREDALIEYVDVAPTLLELAGVEPMLEAQGSSFLSIIKDEAESFREYTFAEYLEDNMAMVFDGKWKYVFTTGSRDLGIGYKTGHGPSGIVHRLYDLESDPQESTNVAKHHPERLVRMQELMVRHFEETHPDASNCPTGLSLVGKLVWYCEPRDVGADQSPDDVPVRVFN